MNVRIATSPKRSKSKGEPARDLPSDQVAAIAYHLYLEDGCQDGHDWEHWFRAEQILKESLSQAVADESEQKNQLDMLSFPKGRLTGVDHSQHQTTAREEVRRHRIPPAARQSLRPSK